MTPIRISLVDDHPVVLAGIRALLQAAPEIELVGEASTGATGLKIICECSPDIAVIDLSLPDMSGIELARRAGKRCPEVKIIVLTVHEDRAYVHPVLEAGARGYLLKRSAADELLRAIRIVKQGDTYLDPAIAEKASMAAPHLRTLPAMMAASLADGKRTCSDSWLKGSATSKLPGNWRSASRVSRPTSRARLKRKGFTAGRISSVMASNTAGLPLPTD